MARQVHLSHLRRYVLTAAALLAAILFGDLAEGATYNSPPDAIPDLLLNGDVLNITGRASVQYIFTDPGSTINFLTGAGVFGALVKGTLNAAADSAGMGSGIIDGGTVNARGGLFSITSMMNGGTFNIDGGTWQLANSSGGTINFRSGSLGGGTFSNTTAHIHATSGPGNFSINDASVFNYYGGALTPASGPSLSVFGEIHLFVKSATVGGQPIPGLLPGATVTVSQRNVTLAGTMLDGSPVDMFMAPALSNARYQFHDQAVVRVTQIPEPSSVGIALLAAAVLCQMAHNRAANQLR